MRRPPLYYDAVSAAYFDYPAGTEVRGGDYVSDPTSLAAFFRLAFGIAPTFEGESIGFRGASVPEP